MRYLLHDCFTKAVDLYPDNVAILNENGKAISYKELNSISNRFANYFSTLKPSVKDKPFVGVLSVVNTNSIAAILGALKIGCAYIPLDEYSPVDRLNSIINNTKLDVIVMDPHWFEKHKGLLDNSIVEKVVFTYPYEGELQPKVVPLDDVLNTSDDEPDILNQVSDDLAYILHSSGSTGIPKGIMLTHRNARTFVDWMQKEFKLTQQDVVMSRAPFKFDLSVWDVFNTFNAGATLVCFDWNKKREDEHKHQDYVQLMKTAKASVIYTTPSTLITLMNRGGLEQASIPLREVMYAGEPFPTPQLRKLQEALPNTRIANIYGPTETNIITYWWIDEIPADDSPIPLGYVVDDTEIIVVSEDGTRICEPDEMGELWCRGGTVTIGYLGMPEKTAACLVESPFHKYPIKFWRTGDFGYLDTKGILHYKGRKDHMIKVKGFRIELGEIESALAKNPNLDEFVVVAIPDEKYGNRLFCYYSILGGKSIIESELREFLKTKIPEYMIPYKFFKKGILPKTSSGKVDRVLLAEEVANALKAD
jgi:amino acid adenylation domain-containing protein